MIELLVESQILAALLDALPGDECLTVGHSDVVPFLLNLNAEQLLLVGQLLTGFLLLYLPPFDGVAAAPPT